MRMDATPSPRPPRTEQLLNRKKRHKNPNRKQIFPLKCLLYDQNVFRTILNNWAAGEIPLFRFVIIAEDFSQKDSVAFRLFLKSFFFFAFFSLFFQTCKL